MSTDRARRALELLELAMALPESQVDRFLDDACSGDLALRSDVESLISASRETGEFLPEGEGVHGTRATGAPSSPAKSGDLGCSLFPGDTVMERYAIRKLVGSGGMGTVYRATDSRLGREVAIKILSGANAADPEMRKRFEREARSAAAFSHPNVMEIYDIGSHEGEQIAVMEFIAGSTLRDLIAEGLSIERALHIGSSVAAGLEAAHARALLHRDIKPENIMVSPADHVKILDFGLARPQAPTEDQDLTRTSITPGTVPYMSPEQSAGESLECSTDVFSLGTVLYEMVTGSHPFRASSAVETMRRVISASGKPLSEVRPGLPEDLQSLVERMHQTQPSARPSAREVRETLLSIRDALTDRRSGRGQSANELDRPPRTQYARCGDIHIAYQMFGDGPVNLLLAPGFISNIDNYWANAACANWLRALGRFCRVAMFDKRGTGLSDRVSDLPNLEERVEDVCAVMDATGFESAAILGISEGGSLASLFAATYPQRCHALILHGSFARFRSWFESDDALEKLFDYIRTSWGSGASLPAFAPSYAEEPEYVEWWGKFERLGANPNAAIDLMRMNSQIDISRILPSIQAPTLVINRTRDVLIDPDASRFLAEKITGAIRYTTESADHVPFFGEPVEGELAAIRDFLQSLPELDTRARSLATVLAVAPADASGEAAIDRIRQQIRLFRGSEPRAYDGSYVSTFEGPVRAIRCAKSIAVTVSRVKLCIHTGEIVLGAEDGPAVRVAIETAKAASDGEVVVTRIVKDIAADSGLRFSALDKRPTTAESRVVYRVE